MSRKMNADKCAGHLTTFFKKVKLSSDPSGERREKKRKNDGKVAGLSKRRTLMSSLIDTILLVFADRKSGHETDYVHLFAL
jgi:hypothetical protein